MKKSKRRIYLERIIHSLKVCHINSIEEAFEGCFREGKVLPARLIFVTNQLKRVDSIRSYISEEFSKHGFLSEILLDYTFLTDTSGRYDFKISNPRDIPLEDYERETTQMLHILPRIFDDYSQKNPKR
jgi:hypothetical protein